MGNVPVLLLLEVGIFGVTFKLKREYRKISNKNKQTFPVVIFKLLNFSPFDIRCTLYISDLIV